MAYNTKSLLRDLEGKIVPQGFDVAADNYRALTGQNLGNNRFGLDGIQWGKTETGLFVPMAVTDEGHVKVQQVGNIVQEVFSRTVRTSNTGTALITSPSGRVNKGCIIVCTIFGVTGTFQSGEGLRLRVFNQAGVNTYFTGNFTFQRQSIAGQQTVYMFPGASRGDMLDQVNRFSMFSGVVPYANHVTLEISGSFDAGQGFDCHVQIIWL